MTSTSTSPTSTPRQSRLASSPVGDGEAEPEEDDEGEQRLEPVDDVVHVAVVVAVPLDRPDGQRAGEDGEEAVAVHEPRRPRRRGGRRRWRAAAPRSRRSRSELAASPEGQPGQRPSRRRRRRPPRRRSCRRRSHASHPGDPVREAAGAGEQHRQVHEGEGQPVVEPGLAGQGEADLVVLVDLSSRRRPRALAVVGPADLDVGGEHRVGRRQGGTEQQRGRQRPPPGDPRRSRATPATVSGMAIAEQPPGRRPGAPRPDQSRARSGRSSASPTPMSETSTVNSVMCVMAGRSAHRVEVDVTEPRQQPDEQPEGRRGRSGALTWPTGAAAGGSDDGEEAARAAEGDVDQARDSRWRLDVPEVVGEVVQTVATQGEHRELGAVGPQPAPVPLRARTGRRYAAPSDPRRPGSRRPTSARSTARRTGSATAVTSWSQFAKRAPSSSSISCTRSSKSWQTSRTWQPYSSGDHVSGPDASLASGRASTSRHGVGSRDEAGDVGWRPTVEASKPQSRQARSRIQVQSLVVRHEGAVGGVGHDRRLRRRTGHLPA